MQLLYIYFLFLGCFFKSGPSISPNIPPESLDPYFLTASFVCFSSKALIESDTFFFFFV